MKQVALLVILWVALILISLFTVKWIDYYFKEKDHERKENVCAVQSTTDNNQTFIHYWG